MFFEQYRKPAHMHSQKSYAWYCYVIYHSKYTINKVIDSDHIMETNKQQPPFEQYDLCNVRWAIIRAFIKQILYLKLIQFINLLYKRYQMDKMQLMELKTKELKEGIIAREEYGTIVEKDKKKKKKKNKHEKSKDIDQDKIKQYAKASQLHQVSQLTPQQKQLFSVAEYHPLKIICTNLPFKITREEVFQYFNTVIAASNPDLSLPLPIQEVQFDKTKTFAIISISSRKIKDYFRTHSEFNYIEGTTTFKMVKPRDFFAEKYYKKKEEPKSITGDNKIYLGGLPLSFTDEQVRKICDTFGKLKYFNLVREGQVSKGYCFMQYEEHKHGEKAIKALNGFPITDKKLKCHSANLGDKNLSLGFTPASFQATKPANHAFGSYLLSYENITNFDIQMTFHNQLTCKVPSRVIQLLNMCYPQDLFEDQFVEDLELDVLEECKKHGPMDVVVVPRPNKGCGYAVPTVGKVFAKFMYITHAKKARQAINGRVYNKRTVIASYYPEEKFNTKEYLVTI